MQRTTNDLFIIISVFDTVWELMRGHFTGDRVLVSNSQGILLGYRYLNMQNEVCSHMKQSFKTPKCRRLLCIEGLMRAAQKISQYGSTFKLYPCDSVVGNTVSYSAY